VLAVGSVAGGLLAYVFFTVVTRALGPEDAAPVSVLWTAWTFASAALTFPLQHWTARTAEAAGGEGGVRAALPRVAAAVAALAALAVLAGRLVQGPLFHRDGWAFPLLLGGVCVGAALAGHVRGVLSARRRFGSVAVNLAGENAVRVALAVALVAAGVDAPAAYGACLLAGYVVVLLRPSVYRLEAAGRAVAGAAEAFLGSAAVGQLLAQAVLTGGPVLLALAGGAPADVTALFAALALFRAPYTFAIGMVAPLTGAVTRLVVERRTDRLRRIRLGIVAAAVAGAVVGAALAALLGPFLLRLVFGPDVRLAAGLCAVLAAATALAMANLVATVVVMAHGRTTALLVAWVAGLVPGAVWFATAPGSGSARTAGAFLVVEAVALVVLVAADARASARLGAARGR
jgi:O-antigen/teichoic acid export membrane protein